MMWHFSFAFLQIEQLLCEVKIAEDKEVAIQEYVSKVKAALLSMPSDQAQHKVGVASVMLADVSSVVMGRFQFCLLSIQLNDHIDLAATIFFLCL
jgi:hypothetical protein